MFRNHGRKGRVIIQVGKEGSLLGGNILGIVERERCKGEIIDSL
jgi:hypothetical protein